MIQNVLASFIIILNELCLASKSLSRRDNSSKEHKYLCLGYQNRCTFHHLTTNVRTTLLFLCLLVK